MAAGCRGDTVSQDIRAGVGFETGDLVKEKLGGLHRKTTLHHIFLGFLNFGSFKTSPRKLT